MDKNKNRTDLLAAGRKKLQQYRQKKGGKGSKSSSKANKPDPDVISDESSSVSKPTKGKKQSVEAEVSIQDSDTELVDSSNADMATSDLSSASDLPTEVSETDVLINTSVQTENTQSSNLNDSMQAVSSLKTVNIEENPESDYVFETPLGLNAVFDDKAAVVKAADVSTSDLSSTSDIPAEVSETDVSINTSVPDENVQSSNLDDAVQAVSSLQTVNIEGNRESDYVFETPVGLNAVSDNKTGEVKAVSGDDKAGEVKATDVATSDLSSTPDLRTEVSETDVSVNTSVPVENLQSSNVDAMQVVSSLQTVNIERNFEGADVFETPLGLNTDKAGEVRAASGDDQVPDLGAMQEHEHSSSEPVNTISLIDLEKDDSDQVQSEEFKEDTKTEYTNSAPEQTSQHYNLDPNNIDLASSTGPQSSDPEPTIQPHRSGDSDTSPVSLTQLAKTLQFLSEDEFRFVVAAREVVSGGDLKNDGDMKSDSVELHERLKEQLCISIFEKELTHLQLCEEWDLRKEVDFENKVFSEEIDTCRSELYRVTSEMEKLQISLNRSERELSDVSSKLIDSRNLLSELLVKNENLSVSVFSLTEEKHKLEKEKGDLSLENENFKKELMECKESLDIVMVERANLEEEKECYVSENEQFVKENENISIELLESQSLVESLQSEVATLNENLELVTKEKTRLGEEVNQLNAKKEYTLLDLTESQQLVESLSAEIAKLSEDLDLETEEKTRLEEEVDRLTVEKKEALTGLSHCETLMNDLQVEYEKSMADYKDRAHLLEQLTEENFSLTTTLQMFEAKINEFDDWKMTYDQKAVQETITTEENSEHLFKDSLGFMGFKKHLSEVENVMQGQSSSLLEESFLENVILDEYVKQYVLTVESKKAELVILCENLKQEVIIARTKNSELSDKFSSSESRIQELQEQVVELGQQADHLTDKNKELEGTNELASYVIHKVFDNLQKIVENSDPSTEQREDDNTPREQLDHLEISNYDVFIEKLIMMLHERAQLEYKNREYNVELLRRMEDMEELNKRCINPDVILKLFENVQSLVTLNNIEIKPDEPLSSLESVIHFLIKNWKNNEMKVVDLQNEIDHLTSSVVSSEIQSHVLKGSLSTAMEQNVNLQSEAQSKESELGQSEQRVSALREKLHIAVTKGKGLIQQRESLKQNLTATSNELEKCLHELQLKDATLQETETKLKTYSEAGERMEALESELSYIRNSATALRESFLLKDSVLQRIEEILEELDLPEDFHIRDIIDKIDWLAKSVSQNQNSFPVSNQHGTLERTRSFPESGSRDLNDWREGLEPASGLDDELRRNYEELQNKFYGLAEQNEMLEQSLMERNNLVQRWEEVLDKITMPSQFRSLEPEDRIEWLRVSLLESNDRCSLLQQDISELEKIRGSLTADLEESERRLVDLESTLKAVTDEREQLSARMEAHGHDYNELSEKAALHERENEKHQQYISELEKIRGSFTAELEKSERRLVDLESTLKAVTDERDQLSARLEAHGHDYNELSEKAALHERENERENEKHQQDISELEKIRGSFTAELEESKRRLVDLESTLKAVTDERDQLSASLEAHGHDYNELSEKAALLERENEKHQQDFSELKKIRGSLAAELEESERRLVDLESNLKAVTDERDQLSARLEAHGHDYNELSEKAALHERENEKLRNEVGTLHLKLDEKRVDEEHIRHIHGEIRRLQDLVREMLEVSEIEDFDSNTSDIKCLEVLLRKLADKHITVHRERSLDQSNMHEELERKLEAVEGDLLQVKNERERLVEKSQTLVNEVEALKIMNQELQNSLVQEEQKTVTVREKLNVAVKRGKSLVQARDSMKQTINDLTSQVERLNDEIKVRENTILEFQHKMKDLFISQELVENKDSEIRFLENRLDQSESELRDQRNTVSMIVGALAEIDSGVDLRTNDPIENMKQIAKRMQDLQASMSSAEQDSRKSKRAAELLLAELNEVQERNEDLLEEISELSKQRDSAEASKRESLTRFEQLSALHLEERSTQVSGLMNLNSGLEQLSPGLSKIFNLLNNVLPKELDYLYNVEAGDISSSESSAIGSRSESKVNFHLKSFLGRSKTEELHNDNIIDLWRLVGSHMQDLITNLSSFEEKLQNHTESLHEEVTLLSEKVPTLLKEVASHKHSLDSAKEEIAWLESAGKQKETEIVTLRKYISVLYEACKNSVLEIEKNKGQMVTNDSFAEDILSGETISSSEEDVMSIVNRLLLAVKDCHSIQTENVEGKLKEMKDTISTLQKEVTEKDVQKDRISVELVSQIKRAEAVAMSHLQELEAAKAHINDLREQRVKELEGKESVLVDLHEKVKLLEEALTSKERRVKELEGQESVLVNLHEKVKSLEEALTSKEQENEALLQALDEEEAQMEGLTNKNTELERFIQQKNLDLESSEAARGKALKKLSVTVSKFDELHHLSETLVSEVDKLQSQLQERDSEISFLRDEITRITSDSLQSLKTDERGLTMIQDILTWLDSMASGVEKRDVNVDADKNDQGQEYKEMLKKQISSIILELKDLRQVAQSKDDQLHAERTKVDELMRSLREKESRLSFHGNDGASSEPTSMTSEIVEVEPLINNWQSQGTSMASQVRSLRKVNNDQLAISIDEVDSDDRDKLDDEDDDKAHGFKSLTTSKLVPRFTRPVTDFVDGLWVSCDRTLMRQPALRLSLILYWALMHALLAAFVV